MSDRDREARYDKEAVLARVQLPELCEQLGIPLKRAGGNAWKGNCPFHAERTASFTVSSEERTGWHYHCFGCGAHGDAIALWRERQGGTFPEALRALAGIVGLAPLPDHWKPRPVRA